jgi:regulator of replication initiation timing
MASVTEDEIFGAMASIYPNEPMTEDEIFGAMAEMRLLLIVMDREIQSLRAENKNLKEHLQTTCMTESAKSETSAKKQLAQRKWAFYREKKDEIRETHKLTDWRDIKRITDELYDKQDAA